MTYVLLLVRNALASQDLQHPFLQLDDLPVSFAASVPVLPFRAKSPARGWLPLFEANVSGFSLVYATQRRVLVLT